MDLVHPLAGKYAENYSSPESELLSKVDAYTREHHSQEYIMLSGHLQGKVLEMLSTMMRPDRILEIGTFTGYSALCLAKGLAPNGKLHTIDIRSADSEAVKTFFDQSPYRDQIILHSGDAAEIIPRIDETWDLVFIDADKPSYIRYFNLVFPMLRKNGFILADNILFHGQVLDGNITGKNAKGIQAFNDFVKQRTDIESVVLTVRDGLFLIQKL